MPAVVELRSYSRISGATSQESEIARPGNRLRSQAPRLPLVRRVREGVEEADGDRLDARPARSRRDLLELRLVERREHLAAAVQALVDLEPERARHERLGQRDEEVVDVVAHLLAHLEHVAEAARRDEAVTAPSRSIRAFVISVVPCTASSTAPAVDVLLGDADAASRRAPRAPARAGVVSVL